jgi:DNA-binding NarL/FixJ family response regulator
LLDAGSKTVPGRFGAAKDRNAVENLISGPPPRVREDVMTIRILVVDDHPVVRHGLRTLLGGRPEWEVIDEAEDGLQAVDKAESLRPDIVVLDVGMPKMNGLEACRIIRRTVPECEILFVTQHDSPQMMREALSAGARGYVVKSNAARDLLAAVEAVSQHRPFTALNGSSSAESS